MKSFKFWKKLMRNLSFVYSLETLSILLIVFEEKENLVVMAVFTTCIVVLDKLKFNLKNMYLLPLIFLN